MQLIAARAEIAPATAYRYYSTVDDLLRAYMSQIVGDLRDFSHASTSTGPELFDAVAEHWVDLILVHGPVMVQLRSRRGFIERLRADDEVIVTTREAWQRPIKQLLREMGLSPRLLPHALFVLNLMFDPREVLDLKETVGMSRALLLRRLRGAYRGALRGWQDA